MREIVVAHIHFADYPSKYIRRFLGISNNRSDEVRNAFVAREFYSLGVNHD